MIFSRETEILGSEGIEIKFDGRTYTTVENIHGEEKEYAGFGVFCLKAQCTTDAPEIMWGQGDENADWFPPEAMWVVDAEELDAWIAKGDLVDCLTGVLVCGEQPA